MQTISILLFFSMIFSPNCLTVNNWSTELLPFRNACPLLFQHFPFSDCPHPRLQYTGIHLARYAQYTNAAVVLAFGSASFLMDRECFLPVYWNTPAPPCQVYDFVLPLTFSISPVTPQTPGASPFFSLHMLQHTSSMLIILSCPVVSTCSSTLYNISSIIIRNIPRIQNGSENMECPKNME